MVRGWFVGGFSPAVVNDNRFEVAVQMYDKGSKEDLHVHKVAYEITVIAKGRARMNNQEFEAGDIIHIHPGEHTDFEALEDTITVVVKAPSVPDDKFLI